jgi:hypothetical protein
MVVIGIVAEVVFLVLEHKDDQAAWARGIIRPSDRPSGRRLALEISATVLRGDYFLHSTSSARRRKALGH